MPPTMPEASPVALNHQAARAPALVLRATLLAALALAGLPACTAFDSVKDPVLKFLRRGSCISVDVPPITLTPARTAAERQLIGQESEIEDNGWLIASAQSARYYQEGGAATASAVDPEATGRRRYYIELGVLEFYREPALRYRSEGALGESYEGKILLVPDSVSGRRGGVRWEEEIQTARDTADEINRARDWVFRYELDLALQREPGADRAKLETEIRQRYFREAQNRSGEWIYTAERRWVRVR